MLERLHFLVVYVGSAAMAALLAVCLSAAQVAASPCDTIGAISAEECELPATLVAAVPEAEIMNADNPAAAHTTNKPPQRPHRKPLIRSRIVID